MMKSRVFLTEEVENTDRCFGSIEKCYPAIIICPDGTEVPALFTRGQVLVATNRAASNMEDLSEEERTWWQKIFS